MLTNGSLATRNVLKSSPSRLTGKCYSFACLGVELWRRDACESVAFFQFAIGSRPLGSATSVTATELFARVHGAGEPAQPRPSRGKGIVFFRTVV